MTIALTIDLFDDAAVPVLLVAGLPGHQGQVAFLIAADGAVRTLWPTRDLPARLPERPMGRGLRSLASLLRDACQPEGAR